MKADYIKLSGRSVEATGRYVPAAILPGNAGVERSAAQRPILDVDRLVSLTSAEEADRRAIGLEQAERSLGTTAVHRSNEVDKRLVPEVAGDYAMRARLYRDRASELRS
jgi:hypothetical protein